MEIVKRCRSEGLFLHPDAREKLEGLKNPDKILEEVIDSISPDESVVLPKHIESRLENAKNQDYDNEGQNDGLKNDFNSVDNSFGNFEIRKDITKKSECEGELENFLDYFDKRFKKLSQEIRKRNGMGRARPLESLSNFSGEVSVIGMVTEIRNTSNGHKLIKLEDKTGAIPALALKSDEDVFQESEKVLLDEVIGVQGRISNKSDLLIIKKIIWPDLPIQNEANTSDTQRFAAFISDIHFGSKAFLGEAWDKFVNWINGKVGDGDHKELAKKIDYLVIAGDIVEGVGIYPGQEEVLAINSIKNQYEKAAKELGRIRDDLKIFLSPGNHDAVRQAEPQPALCDKMKESFSDLDNIEFIGNPSLLDLDGVNTLVYHGRSLDDLVADLPNKSYQEPANLMKEYVKRRHLVPSYGKNTPIAPEKDDYLFVESPDIIHSGHIHKFGIERYRGVTLLNTGTWQGQTKFQRKKGIQPTPGRVVVYDLMNNSPKIVKFSK
ncbi:DNA polymerase II [archaeon SCG-AAA382B04]|nr:DNA polymerase II [archaeon SCG-AAA382B04]